MSVSVTAQVLGQAAQIQVADLLGYGAAILAAILLATPIQACIEGLIQALLPAWAIFAKPFIPTLIAGVCGKIATALGVSPSDALIGAAALASATHWVNEQPWAVNLEGKYPTIWKAISTAFGDSATKAVLVLVALLGLGAGLKASSLSLGPISLSPTAGPLQVVVQPFLGVTFWRAGAGVVLVNENDAVGGLQVMLTSGPYGLGIVGAVDQDIDHNKTYGAAGVAGEVLPWGEAAVLWRDAGALVCLTVPWGLEATVK